MVRFVFISLLILMGCVDGSVFMGMTMAMLAPGNDIEFPENGKHCNHLTVVLHGILQILQFQGSE